MRRDVSAKLVDDHCCDTFTTTTKVLGRWREGLLNCRQCKRSLVKFLTNYFLDNINTHLQGSEALYIAGGFDGTLTGVTCSKLSLMSQYAAFITGRNSKGTLADTGLEEES